MDSLHFNSITKSIVAFGSLFLDIHLRRYNLENIIEKNIKVPVYMNPKRQSYNRDVDNRTTQGRNLPAISIVEPDVVYDVARQKSNMSAKSIVQQTNENGYILKYMRNPTPIELIFKIIVQTKYQKDFMVLMETIVPEFQPTKFEKVNLLDEMGLSYDMPVTLTAFESMKHDDFHSDSMLAPHEFTLTFTVKTFIFPPIEEKKALKNIKLNNNGVFYNISKNYSANSIINDGNTNLLSGQRELVYQFSNTFTEDKDYSVIKVDLSNTIDVYGEKLEISDINGNKYNFVYEYDNDECYGADYFIPENISLNKTGYVYIRLDEIEGKIYDFNVFLVNRTNYVFGYDVFPSYEDFNNRNFNRLMIENKKPNDLIYIDSGLLYIQSFDNTLDESPKVFSSVSIPNFEEFIVKINNFSFIEDVIICGLSDQDGNLLYIKCSSTENVFNIYDDIGLKGTITSSTVDKIKFRFMSGALTIDIDGNEYGLLLIRQYVNLFVTSNNSNINKFDLIRGF